MGEGKLLSATAALIIGVFLSPPAVAQGPVYRERWSYLYLERLRDCVFAELAGRDEETVARVGRLLAEPARGMPFRVTAAALAALRGVELDAAFELRATLCAFPLPEVVDPEASNEVCRALNVTVFLPFTVDESGELAFAVTVRDVEDEVVFEATIEREATVADLRRARPEIVIPAATLADGRYLLEIATRIDGEGPRAADPSLSRTFFVLRGYQARSEAAMAKVREVHAELEPLPRALLLGIGAEVSRAYMGEASDGANDAVEDLVRLERALDNLAAERPVLYGMSGDVATALPAADGPLSCVLRLGDGRLPAAAAKPRPLVVFADGAPAYDLTAHRPTAPSTRGPRWLAQELPEFGSADECDVAFLASPGGGRAYTIALPQVIAALRQLFGTGDRPVVLVAEREAASVVSLALRRLASELAGIVLIGAGAVPAPALAELGACRVRIALLQDCPGSQGLLRTLAFVEQRQQAGALECDFALLGGDAPAWPFGTRSLAAPILTFVREIAGS